MKRELLFIVEQMLPLLDDKRLEKVARHRGIRAKEGKSAAKLLSAFVRKSEESDIGMLIVEAGIQLSARAQPDGGKVLRAAAQAYKVDTGNCAQGQARVLCQGEGEEGTPTAAPKLPSKAKKAA